MQITVNNWKLSTKVTVYPADKQSNGWIKVGDGVDIDSKQKATLDISSPHTGIYIERWLTVSKSSREFQAAFAIEPGVNMLDIVFELGPSPDKKTDTTFFWWRADSVQGGGS